MADWTIEDLYNLDLKYAKEGLHLHQRPFHAAAELLGASFVIGVHGNPEVNEIIDAYEKLMPETNTSWPGAGIGIVASGDRVRKLTLPVIYGNVQFELWKGMAFESPADWWSWCKTKDDIARESCFSFADAFDFANGLNELENSNTESINRWKMAQSNLHDIANTLPTAFSVDSVIQPICLVAELSIKGALLWHGVEPRSLEGRKGHDLIDLAKKLATAIPHRDDALIIPILSKLPNYVESRYNPSGLTRLEVVRLALGVQFIAASTLRRVSTRDFAKEIESGDWPASRPHLFP